MSFNPDPSRQAQKLFLIEKLRKCLILHNLLLTALSRKLSYKKRLGIFLGAQLTFKENLKVITTKVNKTIGLSFPKTSVNDSIQSFCDATSRIRWRSLWWTYNKIFHRKVKSVQYNACLALSRTIGGSSREIVLTRIRLGTPATLTLVLETLLVL